ncbi:OB-fold protein [Flavobacterium faecale]|uniref:OB-fold protein n=1 Tax=Flavobacterium faecale TaxID=1355330 RepID=UPI003AADBF39
MKKYIIIIGILILTMVGGYFYIYKVHRNIENEKEVYNGQVENIFMAYQENEIDANLKYLDKTIVVTGFISSFDEVTKTVVIEHQLHAVFIDSLPDGLKIGEPIEIKGRLIGFDSLLEELKMDQSVVIK